MYSELSNFQVGQVDKTSNLIRNKRWRYQSHRDSACSVCLVPTVCRNCPHYYSSPLFLFSRTPGERGPQGQEGMQGPQGIDYSNFINFFNNIGWFIFIADFKLQTVFHLIFRPAWHSWTSRTTWRCWSSRRTRTTWFVTYFFGKLVQVQQIKKSDTPFHANKLEPPNICR